MPYTCKCGQVLDLVAVLDGLPRDGTSQSGMVGARCGGCGEGIELRLCNGCFQVGYSYFGGSMHFEPMDIIKVRGLKVAPSDPDDLHVTLGEREWHFSVERPSHHRFIVFENAFAAGKRLAQLNFVQWSVLVTSVERQNERLEPQADLSVEPGDFLHLSGPAPALTRAWHYMNDGKDSKSK